MMNIVVYTFAPSINHKESNLLLPPPLPPFPAKTHTRRGPNISYPAPLEMFTEILNI